MPVLHPYHQILLRKAVVNEYKGNFDTILKGSEIKNLAANDLNVSYNTLRKLFLSNDENSNFQEYTIIKIIWYLSKSKGEIRFNDNKAKRYWYNFQRYFPIPKSLQTIDEVHFNTLPKEIQNELTIKVINLLEEIHFKEIDFSGYSGETFKPSKKEKNGGVISGSPIEGIYAVYRTDNKIRLLEKRYARIVEKNGNYEFELKTSNFTYKSSVFEYKYPAIYLVFDNGMSKITFNLHCGNIRLSDLLIGTFSHFSVSAGKADAGVVIFVKQDIPDKDFEKLQGQSSLLTDKPKNREETVILNYFKSLDKPSFAGQPAINLNELEQITKGNYSESELKQLEIIKNYYTGSYFLYGKNKNDDDKIIKSPCRILLNEHGKPVFEISGRTYSFKSKSVSLYNNFLYVEIDNELFNDKGFYTFSLSPTTQPKFITGIATFINAENKPMSRRVALYKLSDKIENFDSLNNSKIEISETTKELAKYDQTIIDHFKDLTDNIIIDKRIEY